MSHRRTIATGLAHAFLADGPWTIRALRARGTQALGEEPAWLVVVARAVRRAYPRAPTDRCRELSSLVEGNPAFARALTGNARPTIRRWLPLSPEMRPSRWDVPPLPTTGDLARFLDVTPATLHWLADVRSLERVVLDEKLRNYRYGWVEKRAGGARLLESPKPRLRELQRRVLHQILDRIPPHRAAHGFRAGCSAVTFAAPHAGRAIVMRFDLESFFPSVGAPRVFGVFREAGYPEAVAHVLTALVVNRLPPWVWQTAPRPRTAGEVHGRFLLGRRLAGPHLPQGAPTSPALANLSAFRLDVRLASLATALGGTYTRYADDLAFSGDDAFASRAAAIGRLVERIVKAEGFRLNVAKTRVMRRSTRQRLCGLVVNDHPQVPREDYDLLKAILHNAGRNGLEAENRHRHPDFRAHLRGRIAWVAASSPARGQRLLAALERIA